MHILLLYVAQNWHFAPDKLNKQQYLIKSAFYLFCYTDKPVTYLNKLDFKKQAEVNIGCCSAVIK